MKPTKMMLGVLSLSALSIIPTTIASADAYVTTSIIDQIQNPGKGSHLNNDEARNWEMNGNQYCIQATTNGEIPYKITSTDPYYRKIWTDAANAWNKLGIIKFVPVTSGEQITLGGRENTNKNTDWYGITGDDIQIDDNDPTRGYLLHTDAKLAGHLSKKASHYQFNLVVAEHELGHTLGFAHDNSRTNGKKGKFHVMHDGNSYEFNKKITPLGQYEKQTLLQYYQPGATQQPDHWYTY